MMNAMSKKECSYIHSSSSKVKLTKAHFIDITSRCNESSKYFFAYVWCEPHCSDRSMAQNLTDQTTGVKLMSLQKRNIYMHRTVFRSISPKQKYFL
jgi:hypothetical protein